MNKLLPQTADFMKNPLKTDDRSVLQELASQKALEITQSLQTTLDPTRLIEIFSAEVGALIVHQGVRYRNDDVEIDLKLGRQARHACTYHLNIGDEPLGKLSFRRNQKFTDAEIEALEQLLCSLLYPLRNGLLYEDALQLAQKDPLTGICNRAALDEMLQRELSHALRKDADLSMLVLDIDHFKNVNDRYGHIVGDCALKAIAHMVDTCKRDGDLLFRYGGEEFVVLMRDTDLAGAHLLAERIRKYIAKTSYNCSGADLNVTVSIGVSELQQHDSPVTIFSRADQALYRAKKDGRNKVCIADTNE
ncbi:diguanylate cyclase/phosphodiesterase (GGDEF & EAL domains) with PAS/PAC sensor(s) [hydrothermal vent metagenome]|uniref:Diguanylate cyclase/phosphodiesterase (GGDEF & EAL domains) with PAS/PAC sensor(S) n=1 Tax=hydrothermal vent metagenome TaxID=652676 RepID=A0A3B0Y0W8_9ZZZZ